MRCWTFLNCLHRNRRRGRVVHPGHLMTCGIRRTLFLLKASKLVQFKSGVVPGFDATSALGRIRHRVDTSTRSARLGLYHHLLVGQAGKSFFERTLRVVLPGCGCVLRLRPSRFPFSGFFRRRRRASRRSRPSLTYHSPRTPFPVPHCPSLPLSPAFSAPLLLLTLSAVRRPHHLRVSPV